MKELIIETLELLKKELDTLTSTERIILFNNYRGIYGVMTGEFPSEELVNSHIENTGNLEVLKENLEKLQKTIR